MPSTLRFGTDADYENAANLREEFKRYMQGVTQSIPTPRTSTMEAALPKERIEAAKVEGDPLALALPTISSGPQEFAAKIIESLKRDPRMFDWFNKTFAKQEAVSTLGNPVMGFHGRTTDYPLEEIRGGTNHVIDQVLGSHWTVDPDVAQQFALHKGYSVNNLPSDFEAKLSKWLKEAQDTGYGYNAVPGADKVTYGGMGAYQPEGGNVMPAFMKSENPYIIKQGWNPTEYMPKPTPMIDKGKDAVRRGNFLNLKSEEYGGSSSGLMNDSQAIKRDFFQTLFQDSPRQRSLGNAEHWISGSNKPNATFNRERLSNLHDRGTLGENIDTNFGLMGQEDSITKHFVEKYKNELRSKGYDSIMYHNTAEAPGNLDPRTFIMIEPNNIISPFDFDKLRRMGGR